MIIHTCFRLKLTVTERISGVTVRTGAYRSMIDHRTLCQRATGSWTRIPALFVDTSEATLTVGVDGAFWSAIWRNTEVTSITRTRRVSVYFAAL